jgi:peptidoglycan/xylan/chitin deacetylase (PgdA/CDA1 family)
LKSKICFFTNDVENTSIVNNILSDKTGELVIKEGMPILLDVYSRYKVKSTFFFTGDIAQKHPSIVRMVSAQGHEVACHGFSHEIDRAFELLNLNEQIENLSKSKKILEDICGEQVISFRAPALRVNKYTVEALEKTGFLIDSSIASQRFDMFMSYGSKNKLNRLFAPRLPYKADVQNLSKIGNSKITEIPISAMLLPYIGTTMRIFPLVTLLLRYLLHFENKLTHRPVNFLIHPNELIEEERDPKIFIRRSQNIFNYMLADLLRNKLKQKNLGEKASLLFEKEVRFFYYKGYDFLPLKNYLLEKEF